MIKLFFIGSILILFGYRNPALLLFNQVPYTKDTLIDVGTHKLHFIVTKGGEPTILLEAGGGADASQWEAVQQKLATETSATIISYDRAGFGKSELPSTPYDIKKETENLHTCLKSLGVTKIVLVSHSYGALLSQAYQFMYPKTVMAIILADPNNVSFIDSFGVEKLMRIPFDTTKPLTIKQKADVRQLIATRNTVETLQRMPFSKKIPITVISAEKDWWPSPQWNRWWKNSHQSIVNTSANRTLIIAESSAHNIPKERPDIIVDAIKKMIK